MSCVYGVDGCPGGWAVVAVSAQGELSPEAAFAPSLRECVAEGAVVAVDMPIGLPERIEGPGRRAEQAVRPHLGARQSSVFSIPSRAAVYAPTYEDACAAALATSNPPRKVSRQAFNLFPKIRELDRLLTPQTTKHVFECHPELAFWRLNGGRPMPTPKRVKGVAMRDGLSERIDLLIANGYGASFFDRSASLKIPLVDLVDAAVVALMARRIACGQAQPFPNPPDRDEKGIPIAIWA